MMSCLMRSLLLILVFALVNSQARTLKEEREAIFEGSYGGRRRSPSPPPSPKSATPIGNLSPLFAKDSGKYGRSPPAHHPPPPKGADPKNPMATISRKPRSPPPAPKLPPPHHQVSGGGVPAAINELLWTNLFASA